MRHIIICEGESESAYLQRLQSFLEEQDSVSGRFEPALNFMVPKRAIAKGGSFGKLKSSYNSERRTNKNIAIQIWADFDIYHRNYKNCADHYKIKTDGIPDFQFSFHNFEDFYALHFDGPILQRWLQFGSLASTRHFTLPLHSVDYQPEFRQIFPGYVKGVVPVDFVSWQSLKNLKVNLAHQPTSNPHNVKQIGSFAGFLIGQIDQHYPGKLA